MARVCIFCRGRPTTREHIFPRWLRDALPGLVHAERFRISDAEGNQLWEQATFDIQARVVCRTCNNGWMSDLEAICGPLLVDPMLYGSGLALHASRQRTVALWAIKTAVVLEAAQRHGDTFRHLAEWHASWMPRTRASGEGLDPPPGISVVAFGRQPQASGADAEYFTLSRSVGITAREPPNDSKIATFVVGYMGFQVFGVNVRAGGLLSIWYDPWVTERVTPLWPPAAGSVAWPPGSVMSTADVLRFADLFSTVERPFDRDGVTT